MFTRTTKLWIIWIAFTIGGSVTLGATMYVGGDRTALLIGETTSAHHQIELACESCHTAGIFEASEEVNLAMNDACLNCHQEELNISNDSHPVKKFKDPRNADVRESLDALFCSTCHAEHVPEITNVGAVTQPADFCSACHQEIGEFRESHTGLSFDTCASAGCHNFHDNTALYEDFLIRHGNKPDFFEVAVMAQNVKAGAPLLALRTALKSEYPVINLASYLESVASDETAAPAAGGYVFDRADDGSSSAEETEEAIREPVDIATLYDSQAQDRLGKVLTASMAIAPEKYMAEASITAWDGSAHALAGINCAGCHAPEIAEKTNLAALEASWIEYPDVEVCASCHTNQTNTFIQGKHGMRFHPELSAPRTPENPVAKIFAAVFKDEALPAMTVAEARLPMFESAHDKSIGNCNTCHLPHEVDIQQAAQACATCHADDHSVGYFESTHFELWKAEMAGTGAPGTGVSCATCHMPKQIDNAGAIFTTHNQNSFLRPNEKMIRPVCLSCHSIDFSIDALADTELVEVGFNGRPSVHIESVDWALKRVEGGQ